MCNAVVTTELDPVTLPAVESRSITMTGQTVTELLVAWADGDEAVLDPLMALVYDELHRIARRHIARERSPSLQATALVHEAYVRLVGQSATNS